jgi:hypothetical protein
MPQVYTSLNDVKLKTFSGEYTLQGEGAVNVSVAKVYVGLHQEGLSWASPSD